MNRRNASCVPGIPKPSVERMGRKPLTTSQRIAIWGVVVPSLISLGSCLLQSWRVKEQIAPIIKMEPKIVNVIENVTRVEKEIANLNEMVRQQNQLWKNETFKKSDLDIRVKKINRPSTTKATTLSSIIFELKNVPLSNSLIVSNERGMMPPNTLEVYRNIVRLKYFGSVDYELDRETDFFNIKYLPDMENTEKPFTIIGMTYGHENCDDNNSECKVKFHFEFR